MKILVIRAEGSRGNSGLEKAVEDMQRIMGHFVQIDVQDYQHSMIDGSKLKSEGDYDAVIMSQEMACEELSYAVIGRIH